MKKALLTGICAVILTFQAGMVLAEGDAPQGAMMMKMDKKGHHGDRLKAADTNNDGAVDRAEYMAQAEARFQKMDADSDGKITAEEHKAARDQMRKAWGERKKQRGQDAAPSDVKAPE